MDKKIAILGYSGHAFVVIETAKLLGLAIEFYCESSLKDFNPYNLKLLGDERNAAFNWNEDVDFLLGIGENKLREKTANLVLSHSKKIINIIHPQSFVSNSVQIGNGVFANANVSVNALSVIGNNCILNTGCIVEHECVIGNNVHIAPGAVLAGNVQIGDRTFIGANSVVKQGVKIGADVIIGAGTVVLNDVPDGVTIYGNPGKIKN